MAVASDLVTEVKTLQTANIPPFLLLEWRKGQVKQWIHESDMRRLLYLQELRGKRVQGRILMTLDWDWCQAKGRCLPAEWLRNTERRLCALAFYTQNPCYHPSISIWLMLHVWLYKLEILYQSHPHHYVKAQFLRRGVKDCSSWLLSTAMKLELHLSFPLIFCT